MEKKINLNKVIRTSAALILSLGMAFIVTATSGIDANAMIINHNLSAVTQNRKTGSSTNGKSTEKLSSGYRINKAGSEKTNLAVNNQDRNSNAFSITYHESGNGEPIATSTLLNSAEYHEKQLLLAEQIAKDSAEVNVESNTQYCNHVFDYKPTSSNDVQMTVSSNAKAEITNTMEINEIEECIDEISNEQ